MTELTRTGIGALNLCDATDIAAISRETIWQHFLPGQCLIGDMPRTMIEDHEIVSLTDGQPVERKYPGGAIAQGEIAGIDRQDRLIAILQPWRYDYFTPKINFSKHWIGASVNNR
jgi:tRNA U55 pseudouridine synthase TruB